MGTPQILSALRTVASGGACCLPLIGARRGHQGDKACPRRVCHCSERGRRHQRCGPELQAIDLVLQPGGRQVRVDADRDPHVAVPEDALHRGRRHACLSEQASRRVAQVVEA
jgi:hypothetical protein